jgi:hypothetical protein
MSGIGGFATRLNSAENFQNTNTSATATSQLTGYLGEITNIALPEVGVTDIDVSSFDSAQNWMEFIAGSKDPGVIDITLNYDPDETESLLASIGDANEIFQISFPDNSIWKSDGYINKMLGGDTTTNDKISGVASVKLSGIPTQSTSFSLPPANNTNP